MQNKHKELYNLLRLCALLHFPACVSAGLALCMQKVSMVLYKHGAWWTRVLAWAWALE